MINEAAIIKFATWYSGMEEAKVTKAYNRYVRENSVPQSEEEVKEGQHDAKHELSPGPITTAKTEIDRLNSNIDMLHKKLAESERREELSNSRLKLAKAELTETRSMLPGVKDDRDYAIKKGKVFERFTEEFYKRHRHDALFVSVYETLIRDGDPYEIMEHFMTLIDALQKKYEEVAPYISPNYYLKKQREEG